MLNWARHQPLSSSLSIEKRDSSRGKSTEITIPRTTIYSLFSLVYNYLHAMHVGGSRLKRIQLFLPRKTNLKSPLYLLIYENLKVRQSRKWVWSKFIIHVAFTGKCRLHNDCKIRSIKKMLFPPGLHLNEWWTPSNQN
jgi:hypothetical protein